ncbi:SDR family oxidoreductase [Leptolyngbya sp. FACHB-541]|uniref:SDR family oxidoreductase n=1 Tax=Leptolyngbya sp. FACHB-541 TaxID=2692810 RepID=UPI001686B8AC|nr:SDR family oxidoreductase [Leptolyngbya sp. FACHB-541]MBD1997578.1 SDR family oxidoreductase [Leptolyngbya sp. FACHB-541]
MTEQPKIAVVTGSNRGLGYAIARKLGQKPDIKVIITSRRETEGLAAKDQLVAEGIQADYHTLDVTDAQSIQQFVEWLRNTYGKVDILVNNAGVNSSGHVEEASLLTAQTETVLSTFTTNVVAVIQLCQALIPFMKQQNYGRIVNVTTEMASLSLIGEDSYPIVPSYRISKVGLNAVTAILAKELQATNVLINTYSPGWLKTDMGGANALFTAEEGAETAVYLATLPDGGSQGKFFAEMRRFGTPIQLPW